MESHGILFKFRMSRIQQFNCLLGICTITGVWRLIWWRREGSPVASPLHLNLGSLSSSAKPYLTFCIAKELHRRLAQTQKNRQFVCLLFCLCNHFLQGNKEKCLAHKWCTLASRLGKKRGSLFLGWWWIGGQPEDTVPWEIENDSSLGL